MAEPRNIEVKRPMTVSAMELNVMMDTFSRVAVMMDDIVVAMDECVFVDTDGKYVIDVNPKDLATTINHFSAFYSSFMNAVVTRAVEPQ